MTSGVVVELSRPTWEEIEKGSSPAYEVGTGSGELECDDGFAPDFAPVQNMYRQVLSDWLLESLPLAEWDARIAASDLRVEPIPEPNQTFYQRYSRLGLRYVYLRNNIHVERLSTDDISEFQSLLGNPEFAADSGLRAIVLRTYSEVLKQTTRDTDLVEYDEAPGEIVRNDALVFEMKHLVRFDAQGEYLGSREMEAEKSRFLYALREELASVLTAALGHEVAVFLESAYVRSSG